VALRAFTAGSAALSARRIGWTAAIALWWSCHQCGSYFDDAAIQLSGRAHWASYGPDGSKTVSAETPKTLRKRKTRSGSGLRASG
jgi:hypothetical protein